MTKIVCTHGASEWQRVSDCESNKLTKCVHMYVTVVNLLNFISYFCSCFVDDQCNYVPFDVHQTQMCQPMACVVIELTI